MENFETNDYEHIYRYLGPYEYTTMSRGRLRAVPPPPVLLSRAEQFFVQLLNFSSSQNWNKNKYVR